MFRILQNPRRALLAGYIEVTVVVLLDKAPGLLVDEENLRISF